MPGDSTVCVAGHLNVDMSNWGPSLDGLKKDSARPRVESLVSSAPASLLAGHQLQVTRESGPARHYFTRSQWCSMSNPIMHQGARLLPCWLDRKSLCLFRP